MLGSIGWAMLPNYVGLHVVLTLDIVIILVIIVIVEIILIALIIIIKVLSLPAILPGLPSGDRWRPRVRGRSPIVAAPVYRPRAGPIVVVGLGAGLAVG